MRTTLARGGGPLPAVYIDGVRALLIVLLVGCSTKAAGTDGKEVFASTCAACHGPAGKPDATMVARIGVKDLTDPEVRPRLTPEHVEQQVRHGSKNKLMPALEGALTDAQIKAVAAYVAAGDFSSK